jgi:catechol 2,3-dioxygenase-like lactoylglutathione lyase family enzyme
MHPRLHLITLGVADLPRSLNFYEKGLGWKKSAASQDNVAFFQLNGLVLALYPRKLLAQDANLPPTGSGFAGISLAYNAKDEAEVDRIMAQVEALGASIVKRPQQVFWGGYSGYFQDPDGHLFEVAYNPFFPFDDRDILVLP